MDLPESSQDALGKRKRVDGHEDDEEDPKYITKLIVHVSSDEGDNDSDDSDGSDSAADENDGEGISGECEYNEDCEGFPSHAAYDKDFAQVAKDLTSIPKGAISIVDQSTCDTKRVQKCRNSAGKLTQLPLAKREKVCLLGNTGAGKPRWLCSK